MPQSNKRKVAAAAIQLRRKQAMQYRIMGLSFGAIAEKLGVSDEQIRRDVKAEAESRMKAAEATIGEQRQLENERLDMMMVALASSVTHGNLGAMDRMIRLSERRAKLNGLDMPTKVAQTDASGENLPPWVSELLNASPDELQRRHAELDARRRATMVDGGKPD